MYMMRKVALFLSIYFLVFWVGYKSGESYYRMKKKMEEYQAKIAIEARQAKLPPPRIPRPRYFFIVEKKSYGTYSNVDFTQVSENHEIISFFLNRKLRPLLKLRDLRIYTAKGNRIY